jgi:hypothetical protein
MPETEFQVYAPNSLLAQQAAAKKGKGQVGPFLNPHIDPKDSKPYGQNSLLDKPGDATPRMSINGVVIDDNRQSMGSAFVSFACLITLGYVRISPKNRS